MVKVSGRRIALLGLCASSLAAACSFPGVTFNDDGGPGDSTVEGAAPQDATSGEGSLGVDTGGGNDGTMQADSTMGDAPGSADGTDVGADVGADAGSDTGPVTGVDAGADAGVDTGADAGVDAGVDTGAGADAGADAAIDATIDAGADVSNPVDAADAGAPPDAGQDAAADTGSPVDSGGVTDGPNCDCAASQMLPTNLTCPSLLGITCKGSGFANNPPCGTSANYYTCTNGVLQCSMQYSGPMVQECQ